MAFKASQIADWMLLKANQEGVAITNMQLQKLAYIMHGWHLATTGLPLFTDHVEAWQYGPVVPSLYEKFKCYGAGIITKEGETHDFGPVTSLLLSKVWDAYKGQTALQLVALTHKPNTPWSTIINKFGRFTEIPNELIRHHYIRLGNIS